MEEALIIFVRNPEKGKVKTRLAAAVGADRALEIYKQLLSHTQAITGCLAADKYVFYADRIGEDDLWDKPGFFKKVQPAGDLGQRMEEAFRQLFEKGYQRVCIIGSDCYELSAATIRQAFDGLRGQPIVLGPAADGGYYLLGMQGHARPVFSGIDWSTDRVLRQTVEQVRALGLSYSLLPVLRDVDQAEDLPEEWRVINSG